MREKHDWLAGPHSVSQWRCNGDKESIHLTDRPTGQADDLFRGKMCCITGSASLETWQNPFPMPPHPDPSLFTIEIKQQSVRPSQEGKQSVDIHRLTDYSWTEKIAAGSNCPSVFQIFQTLRAAAEAI